MEKEAIEMDRADVILGITLIFAAILWTWLGWGIFTGLVNANTLGAVVGFTIVFIVWIILTVITALLVLVAIFD